MSESPEVRPGTSPAAETAAGAPNSKSTRNKAMRSLIVGGILPVIAFSVIEDRFGTVWGLVAGMVFGLGEIIWEWREQGRVSAITWTGNGMILVLGAVSLLTNEGVWFKLQPALIEAGMALGLWVSCVMGKPLLVAMARKQGTLREDWPEPVRLRVQGALTGLTVRLGFFFGAHAALATWAALKWSTAAWAVLKGVGFTGSMVVYLLAEGARLRYRIRQP